MPIQDLINKIKGNRVVANIQHTKSAVSEQTRTLLNKISGKLSNEFTVNNLDAQISKTQSPTQAPTQTPTPAPTPTPTPTPALTKAQRPAQELIDAIGKHETAVLYDDKGVPYVPKTEEEKYRYVQPFEGGAIGKYQIEPETLKTFADDFFEKDVTPEEFSASNELQDKFILKYIERRRDEGFDDDVIIKSWNVGINGNFEGEKALNYLKLVSEFLEQ
jgi:hypothetical protein